MAPQSKRKWINQWNQTISNNPNFIKKLKSYKKTRTSQWPTQTCQVLKIASREICQNFQRSKELAANLDKIRVILTRVASREWRETWQVCQHIYLSVFNLLFVSIAISSHWIQKISMYKHLYLYVCWILSVDCKGNRNIGPEHKVIVMNNIWTS